MRLMLLKRQDYRCALCHVRFDPDEDLPLDPTHIMTHRAISADQTRSTTCNWYTGGAIMDTTCGSGTGRQRLEPDERATVRRESGGSNPCLRQGKLGEMLPGHRSDRMVKTLRDKSMVEKREAGEHARPVVLQGSRDKVKAGMLEPQTPEMERHIHRHGM